jgi:hypothetical protein
MKKQIAKKWAAALRSGKYQQGRAHLKNGSEFCAVGVLYDLYRKEKELPPKKFWEQPAMRDIKKWAGLTSFSYESNRSIIVDNDRGADFHLIADIIEEHADDL